MHELSILSVSEVGKINCTQVLLKIMIIVARASVTIKCMCVVVSVCECV